MRVVFLISFCAFGAWGGPTTVPPSTVAPTTVTPEKSAELSSATLNSKVLANATDVDKKIFPYNNQGFGLPIPGFQGPQSAFGNGFGLNPSFAPYGNPYGQYPGGQNVFPQGIYSPQNPFYNQGSIQPAQVLGQPGQSPNPQGFPQNPLQPGQTPQGLFPQGQLPQGPFPQGQFPQNQFPPQQFPQNQFPRGQPPNLDSNGNRDGNSPPNPINPAGGNSDSETNEPPKSEGDPAPAGGQKEQQDGSPQAQNPAGQPTKQNPSNGQNQLPGQFPAGFQGYPPTLTGSPEFFRNGGAALNPNFFSPTYQILPNGQFLPQGQFDGQLLTPGVFAGQGNGPTQLYPNQPQNPQGQGQFFQRPYAGSPQGAQGPQVFPPRGPQGGFPPGFQAGYPQLPQEVFSQGPPGAFLPNPQGAFPPGSGKAPPNQGGFPVNPNLNNPTQGSVPPQNPGQNPQDSGASEGTNPADPPNTETRGVLPGNISINGPNQRRPFPADQAPQPSQGSELRSPPGGLYNEVAAVRRPPTREAEGTTTTPRPATRRPDP